MVKRDELMRKKKRRLGSFGNMARSLEAGLRDRRRNEIDESISMAAGRARARGGDAHKSHGGFERVRWKWRGMRLGLYSPKVLQVRKEEIGRWIRRRRFWKERSGVGVRKKVLLTHGAMVSVIGRRTPARA
jgi:hypothetical protein